MFKRKASLSGVIICPASCTRYLFIAIFSLFNSKHVHLSCVFPRWLSRLARRPMLYQHRLYFNSTLYLVNMFSIILPVVWTKDRTASKEIAHKVKNRILLDASILPDYSQLIRQNNISRTAAGRLSTAAIMAKIIFEQLKLRETITVSVNLPNCSLSGNERTWRFTGKLA